MSGYVSLNKATATKSNDNTFIKEFETKFKELWESNFALEDFYVWLNDNQAKINAATIQFLNESLQLNNAEDKTLLTEAENNASYGTQSTVKNCQKKIDSNNQKKSRILSAILAHNELAFLLAKKVDSLGSENNAYFLTSHLGKKCKDEVSPPPSSINMLCSYTTNLFRKKPAISQEITTIQEYLERLQTRRNDINANLGFLKSKTISAAKVKALDDLIARIYIHLKCNNEEVNINDTIGSIQELIKDWKKFAPEITITKKTGELITTNEDLIAEKRSYSFLLFKSSNQKVAPSEEAIREAVTRTQKLFPS